MVYYAVARVLSVSARHAQDLANQTCILFSADQLCNLTVRGYFPEWDLFHNGENFVNKIVSQLFHILSSLPDLSPLPDIFDSTLRIFIRQQILFVILSYSPVCETLL